jgi:hypothetical protein
MSELPECCRPQTKPKPAGLLQGILWGLAPHTFCILFIVVSVIGATAATSLLKQLLYVPYFFQIIVALSIVFATISAVFYLRRNGLLSWAGVQRKWKYLTVMFGTTIAINLLFFWVVFPAVANLGATPVQAQGTAGQVAIAQTVTLQVQIPCPGHAPLIIDEVKKADGVLGVQYKSPNLFVVTYDGSRTDVNKILAQEVFTHFPGKQVNPR